MSTWLRLLFSLGLLASISCRDNGKSFTEGYENAQNDAQIAEDEKLQNSPRLYTFEGGTITINNNSVFKGDKNFNKDTITFKDAFYLIKHPKGMLIWDTGLPERLVGQSAVTNDNGSLTISRKDSVITQLRGVGVKPEDVSYIGLSHVHFDHTGGANHFGHATWLVQQSTLDFVKRDSIKQDAFYEPSSFSKLTNLKVLNGDYDVFGDGTVVIKFLPGKQNSAGHQALYLNLGKANSIILSGDTYHFPDNTDVNGSMVNYSLSDVEEDLKDFIKEKEAEVYYQHDFLDSEKIN